MAKKKLKLFVWEGVLTDYTDGIMFAFATDREHARELLLKECDDIPEDILRIEPEEVIKPKAFVLWGGG